MTTLHPFGTTITDATLRQIFAPLNQWEDKYRQLILLGKKLPTLTDERKAQAHEIAGCENRVWLGYEEDAEGRLHFFGDSEGRIVRGLLAVLLTAVEGKTRAGILAQDPLALFDELGLRGQLSASRSQGLSALSEAVLAAAREGNLPISLSRRRARWGNYFPEAAASRCAFASIFFRACDTATNPKVAVTIVAAPKPEAQSIRFGPSAELFIAQTLPSACG